MEPKARVGVLFIHGIGQQSKGETLVYWLDPLVDWVSAWLTGARAAPRDARLPRCQVRKTLLTTESEPANAEVEIHVPAGWIGADAALSRLVFAEAHWADSFPGPTSSEVIDWLLEIGPMTLLLHFGLPVRRAFRKLRVARATWSFLGDAAGLAGCFVKLLLAILLLPLVLAALFLLTLLRLLPIPGASKAILQWIQAALASVLGDSTVFLSSPSRLAAIVTDVRATMDWLEPRCESMIVIAHSQGAAVLREAIQPEGGLPPPSNLAGIVTLGAGLRKLDVLSAATLEKTRGDRGESLMYAAVSYAARFITVIGGIALLGTALGIVTFPPWVVFLLSILVAIDCLLFALLDLESGNRLNCWWKAIRKACPNTEWLDLYASRDPVSNGPLWEEGNEFDGASSIEVFNQRSLLSDHTSYWGNRAGFLARVAMFLSRAGKLEVPLHKLQSGDLELIEKEATARGLRIEFVSVLMGMAWVGLLVRLVLMGRERLAPFGQGVRANLVLTASHLGIKLSEFRVGQRFLELDAVFLTGLIAFVFLVLVYLAARWVTQVWVSVTAMTLLQHDPIDVNIEVMFSLLFTSGIPFATWWLLAHVDGTLGLEWFILPGLAYFALWFYRFHGKVGFL